MDRTPNPESNGCNSPSCEPESASERLDGLKRMGPMTLAEWLAAALSERPTNPPVGGCDGMAASDRILSSLPPRPHALTDAVRFVAAGLIVGAVRRGTIPHDAVDCLMAGLMPGGELGAGGNMLDYECDRMRRLLEHWCAEAGGRDGADDWCQQFQFLWSAYGTADDGDLDPSALALKGRVRAVVESAARAMGWNPPT